MKRITYLLVLIVFNLSGQIKLDVADVIEITFYNQEIKSFPFDLSTLHNGNKLCKEKMDDLIKDIGSLIETKAKYKSTGFILIEMKKKKVIILYGNGTMFSSIENGRQKGECYLSKINLFKKYWP